MHPGEAGVHLARPSGADRALPAARAGIRPGTRNVVYAGQEITVGGDAIVAIDGAPVSDSDDVAQLVAERFVPGEVAWFTVMRGGRKIIVPIVLGVRPR